MNPTDTPADACPHCGAELDRRSTINAGYWCYECGSTYRGGDLCQSPLCLEREKSQKLETEVERLRANLRWAINVSERLLSKISTDGWLNEEDELDQLKATLNPGNK